MIMNSITRINIFKPYGIVNGNYRFYAEPTPAQLNDFPKDFKELQKTVIKIFFQ
jgi:hypothetical protein